MPNVVLVPDIHGITAEFMELADQVSPGALMVDPYQASMAPDTKDESEVYAHFQNHVGLDTYTRYVSEALQQQPTTVVGFSVGAAAIWRAVSELSPNTPIISAIGFYGGQIRHFADRPPRVSFSAVMPASEPHFSVKELQAAITKHPNVTVTRTPYQHGFMNRRSPHFSERGYQEHIRKLHKLASQ